MSVAGSAAVAYAAARVVSLTLEPHSVAVAKSEVSQECMSEESEEPGRVWEKAQAWTGVKLELWAD